MSSCCCCYVEWFFKSEVIVTPVGYLLVMRKGSSEDFIVFWRSVDSEDSFLVTDLIVDYCFNFVDKICASGF